MPIPLPPAFAVKLAPPQTTPPVKTQSRAKTSQVTRAVSLFRLARHVPVKDREGDGRHSKRLQEQDQLVRLQRPQIQVTGDPADRDNDDDGKMCHLHCIEKKDDAAQWQKAA